MAIKWKGKLKAKRPEMKSTNGGKVDIDWGVGGSSFSGGSLVEGPPPY